MNDEQRLEDERIAQVAREAYNAPPATPRDEMWTVIESRLETGVPESEIAIRGQYDLIRLERGDRDRAMGRLYWWMGVAAALLIGLGLGRLSLGTGPAERVAVHSEVSDIPEPAAAETTLATAPDVRDTMRLAPPVRENRRTAGDPPPEPTRSAPAEVFEPGPSSAPYVTATREHLDRSESFLTGVRVDLTAGAPDTDFESWARSLLSRTRLLLASPAGRDPETRRLLEDLELMLAQVVVTAATSDPAEVRLLGEGLEDGDLLRRLRSATSEQTGPGTARAQRTSSL